MTETTTEAKASSGKIWLFVVIAVVVGLIIGGVVGVVSQQGAISGLEDDKDDLTSQVSEQETTIEDTENDVADAEQAVEDAEGEILLYQEAMGQMCDAMGRGTYAEGEDLDWALEVYGAYCSEQ